jgi:hypothetical protein
LKNVANSPSIDHNSTAQEIMIDKLFGKRYRLTPIGDSKEATLTKTSEVSPSHIHDIHSSPSLSQRNNMKELDLKSTKTTEK